MTDSVDTLIRGTMVNVLTGHLEDRTIAIDDGFVVGFGDRPAEREFTAEFVSPGLINGHMHIESTMLSLPRYAQAGLPRGVTGIIADPHEIGNVLGVRGVRALTQQAAETPIRARFTVPSSVPASDRQDAGARIDPTDVAELLDEERVVGLAEVMDIEGVLAGDEEVHAKIAAAKERGLVVDGHFPRVRGEDLHFLARYLDTDHETRELEEAREKVDCGVKLHIREGSSSKNLDELLPLIEAVDSHRLMFCTDNFYIDDLVDHAGMDEIVRRVISAGVDPVTAVQLATVTVSETYDLPFGSIRPGAPADIVLLDDLENWTVDRVMVGGELDPHEGLDDPPIFELTENTVRCEQLEPAAFHLPIENGTHRLRVIDHEPPLATEDIRSVPIKDGCPVDAGERDELLAAVVERHGGDGSIGRGVITGTGLERGAIASTVAHDAHNLVVVGVDPDAMATAANHLRALGGGLVVADPRHGTTALPLPIAGLLSNDSFEDVAETMATVQGAARAAGLSHSKGIMCLDNLTLEVVPELRLTNQGLVDVSSMSVVDLLV